MSTRPEATATMDIESGQPRTVDPDHANCKALGQVLDRIGHKWTVMVDGALSKGPMRFNALLRLIDGVSHRMPTLTENRREISWLTGRDSNPDTVVRSVFGSTVERSTVSRTLTGHV